MTGTKPSAFSIALADTAAIGHINTGVELYRQFEALAHEKRPKGHQLDFNRTIELGVPAVTNLALGLELLLKVHHFQLSGEYPKGHDIAKLGGSFPDETLVELRKSYKRMFDDPKISNGLEFRFSGGSTGRKTPEWKETKIETYDQAIEYIGPMYVRWRYIYEEFQEDVDIRVSYGPLYFSAMSVHSVIRSHKGATRITLKDDAQDA